LPAALGSDAALQGAYRLVNSEWVDFGALLAPHVMATIKRCEQTREVLLLHDTTPCVFPHLDPKEIGYLNTGKAGFPLHLSLAVDGKTWRKPLGIVHAEPLFRKKPPRNRSNKKTRSLTGAETARQPDREFLRWWRGLKAGQEALSGCENVIHIADRESDSYDLMSQALDAKQRFIFRVRVNRRSRSADAKDDGWSTIKQVAAGCEGVLEREVPLSRRKKKATPRMNKDHPPRKARIAKLRFAATKVVIPRPYYLRDPIPKEITLNLVHVVELEPPENETPVEWLLYTTEDIQTAEQVADIVDKYRTRWLIEEFNSALKTGVAYEDRQFETRHALLAMLALSLPIACELLWLRSRSRTNPNAPASEVLTSVQLQVLNVLGSYRLPRKPTAENALLAVAAIGGHLKRNGPPGWKILHRGMVLLLAYEAGWNARGSAARHRDGKL
jgi:hypothetical protein